MKEERDIERKKLEWEIDQIRLRKQHADTPAGFQDKDKERAAISRWELDWEAWKEQQHHIVVGEYLPEPETFLGRSRELNQISEAMSRKSREPVILYGMAGAGKSALVREWVRRHRKEYRHILMLEFEHSFCDTICSDTILHMIGLKYRKEQYGSEKEYFKIKMDLLEKFVKMEKTLIVIENCSVLRDRDMKKVYALNCDLIVTTCLDPVLWGYDGIFVDALELETDWREFAAVNGIADDEETYRRFQKQRENFRGHMLRMIFWLRESKGEIIAEEEQAFEESLLMRIPMKQREKAILSILAVMPDARVPRKMFQTVTGCPDKVLQKLQQFLLVSFFREEEGGEEEIRLHPVAAEAAKRLLPPTVPACARMIRGFAEIIRDKIMRCTAAENRYLEPYIFAILNAFPSPAAYLAEHFGEMCRFLWFQGFREEAIEYILHTFDSVRSYFGGLHQMTGQVALQAAELFYQEGAWEKAENWYKEGLQILENSRPVNRLYYQSLSFACCRIAGVLRQEDRMEAAAGYLERAKGYLKHYRVLPADTDYFFLLRQSITLENVWIRIREGKWEEARQMCRDGIEAARQRFGEHARAEMWYEALEKIRCSNI